MSQGALVLMKWFQSHAGSIEAFIKGKHLKVYVQFQSHAGSIEACVDGDLDQIAAPVSIPRWFD